MGAAWEGGQLSALLIEGERVHVDFGLPNVRLGKLAAYLHCVKFSFRPCQLERPREHTASGCAPDLIRLLHEQSSVGGYGLKRAGQVHSEGGEQGPGIGAILLRAGLHDIQVTMRNLEDAGPYALSFERPGVRLGTPGHKNGRPLPELGCSMSESRLRSPLGWACIDDF